MRMKAPGWRRRELFSNLKEKKGGSSPNHPEERESEREGVKARINIYASFTQLRVCRHIPLSLPDPTHPT
jgi:hypothetical protein